MQHQLPKHNLHLPSLYCSTLKSSCCSQTAAANANQGTRKENNSIHKNKFMFAPCQSSYPCEGSDIGFRYPFAFGDITYAFSLSHCLSLSFSLTLTGSLWDRIELSLALRVSYYSGLRVKQMKITRGKSNYLLGFSI